MTCDLAGFGEFAVEIIPICRMLGSFTQWPHFPPRSIRINFFAIVCAEMIQAGRWKGSLSCLINSVQQIFKKVAKQW